MGADITEFGSVFAESEEVIINYLGEANAIFNDIEDLPFPTVSLVNGQALVPGH